MGLDSRILADAQVRAAMLDLRVGERERARGLLEQVAAMEFLEMTCNAICVARLLLAIEFEGDVESAREAYRDVRPWMSRADAMEADYLLWRATGDADALRSSKESLAFLREHAPPEHRDTMVECLPFVREVHEASIE